MFVKNERMELRPYFFGVLNPHHHVVKLFKRIQYGDVPFNVTECQWAIATPVVNHQILNVLEEPYHSWRIATLTLCGTL